MQPLSPLDGRYASKVDALRPYFTEDALINARMMVEIEYLIALGNEKGVKDLKPFSKSDRQKMCSLVTEFDLQDAARVREIETTTNHDVKAVEYYLQHELRAIFGKNFPTNFIHFALTSEDVNNLAYGVLINNAIEQVLWPELEEMIDMLEALGNDHEMTAMLSLTHGQPATPTTLGKELMVFVDRLKRQSSHLLTFQMQGKFGGAVGNYMAHRIAYPNVDWQAFGRRFLEDLGLDPLTFTTQINPHDDIAELSHILVRINAILLDFSRDVWTYISRGVFTQRVIKGEVGSSTMPHKVNPIDFENAEGNLGLSTALFTHFAEKLPVSRLQRDLSDSTVQRNIGVAFGYHSLALASLRKGLAKLTVDAETLAEELDAHPEVMTEAIQTVLRKNGITDAYERLKTLSRGKSVTWETLRDFVEDLAINRDDQQRLLELLSA